MSRWQTQTVRAIQRAVPVAVITGSGNAQQQNNSSNSNGNNNSKILNACSSSGLNDDVDIDEFEDMSMSSNSGNELYNQECTFTSQQTFSASEVSSLREDITSGSGSLSEEKRQMLEGLFDLAHDPALQNQVLNNPAFGKILTAATRLPLINNDRRNSNGGRFPEIQGTLVLDSSPNGGWSVVIRASLPPNGDNQNNTLEITNTIRRTGSSSQFINNNQNISINESETTTTTTTVITVPDSNETVIHRIWSYVTSLWSWIWPDFRDGSSMVNPISTNSAASSSSSSSGITPAIPIHGIEKIKFWSILGTTMILLALVLRRIYVHLDVAEKRSKELGRLLIMATLDHVFAFDCKTNY